METNKNISELLNERVKELKCLYEVSKVCQNYNQPLHTTIKQILAAIPNGWQYPDKLNAYIIFDDTIFGKENTDNSLTTASSDIIINEIKRGQLIVYYKSNKYVFLEEEEPLLNNISIETASFIERFEQREKEKVLEAKMRHNDKLAVLGELTASIAHELNTPLGNVLGYAELLKKSEKEPVKKEDIQKIISSAINARDIVKKLMYFSCEMPQQFNLININDQVEENIGLLQKQLIENNVNLRLNLEKNLPLIRLDKLQFSQVLFNLVLNAINALPQNGEIHISTFLTGNVVSLSVKDNGSGISEENQAKIFQPFFTTKAKGVGTGLGLSVVHGIVQNHKGKITVNSEVNIGTEFIITFPIETN